MINVWLSTFLGIFILTLDTVIIWPLSTSNTQNRRYMYKNNHSWLGHWVEKQYTSQAFKINYLSCTLLTALAHFT